MRKFVFIIALLTACSIAKSQSNFIQGAIINNNGDTVFGMIDYRNWKNNPQTINFIIKSTEKKVYDASSIKSFHIPSINETYRSFTVEMDRLPGDPDDAINNLLVDSAFQKKNVFLLQLVNHPIASLYLYAENRKDHFYFVNRNEQPVELIHHYIYNESTTQVREIAQYKVQLFQFFSTCSDVANDAQTIKYRKTEIQDIIVRYIKCQAPGTDLEIKKKDQSSLRVGLLAGLGFNKFKFEGTNSLLVDKGYSSNTSPLLGLSIDFGLVRNQNKWHIINELSYKMYKTSSSFTRPFGSGFTRTNNVAITLSYIQLNSLIRFLLQSKASVKPYINIGIGNAFIIAENKNTLHTSFSFGSEETEKALELPKKYEFSILGGAGIMSKKIQIELRYAGSTKSFSPYRDLNVNPKSFQFIITYLL